MFLFKSFLFPFFFFSPRAYVCGQERILAINFWSDLIELIFKTSNLQYESAEFKHLFPFLHSTRGEYCNNEVWSTSCKRGAEVCSIGWRYSELRPGSWILSTPDQRRLPVRNWDQARPALNNQPHPNPPVGQRQSVGAKVAEKGKVMRFLLEIM